MATRLAGFLVVLALSTPAAGAGRVPERLPGAPAFPPELRAALESAVGDAAGHGRAAAHRRSDGSPQYTNRLILESSPDLRQYAHDPVNWYSWGEEAFVRARAEKKLILLSIGGFTCHWCRVMQRESFEDLEIATFINRHYVPIKVDRDQRPDLDRLFMTAVELLTGRGGWPVTLWLTPERAPFFGGSYLPPHDGVRGFENGFLTLLRRAHSIRADDPGRLSRTAVRLIRQIEERLLRSPGEEVPSPRVLQRAYGRYRERFDPTYGGFGRPPRFPRSFDLELLLRYHGSTAQPFAMEMVRRTLDAMARGGIHDQVGGGFHRAVFDRRWRIPRLEKTLHDNALLAVAYLEAHRITGERRYAEVVRSTLRFVERELTSAQGSFYAGIDAGEENAERFYLWTPAQIERALPPRQARLALAYYGVSDGGSSAGGGVLYAARPLSVVGSSLGMTPGQTEVALGRARATLLAARERRSRPRTDPRIFPAANGLMISAFARAAPVLGDPRYAVVAAQAADFVATRMVEDGRLVRSWGDGSGEGKGFLEDYALLIAGLIDLYETTAHPRFLERAVALHGVLDDHFADPAGGYFGSADDAEILPVRDKPAYDGARPSGNAVAIENLLRLHSLTGQPGYLSRARAALRAFSLLLREQPLLVPRMLCAVDRYHQVFDTNRADGTASGER